MSPTKAGLFWFTFILSLRLHLLRYALLALHNSLLWICQDQELPKWKKRTRGLLLPKTDSEWKPLQIDGWKLEAPFWNGPFSGGIRSFSGGFFWKKWKNGFWQSPNQQKERPVSSQIFPPNLQLCQSLISCKSSLICMAWGLDSWCQGIFKQIPGAKKNRDSSHFKNQ